MKTHRQPIWDGIPALCTTIKLQVLGEEGDRCMRGYRSKLHQQCLSSLEKKINCRKVDKGCLNCNYRQPQ